MNHITGLMLSKSIQHNYLEAARSNEHNRIYAPPVKQDRPARRSLWGEMLRVYQLGFASRP